jgi:ankyrin repeat protein
MAARDRSDAVPDAALLFLFESIAHGQRSEVEHLVDANPAMAARPLDRGATRQNAEPFYLPAIHHHLYAGDTALHIAAAAYRHDLAETLVARGADPRARNRRGAEPLHYAAHGVPDQARQDASAQRETIVYLLTAGADPDARDRTGATPLHRAVRSRCTGAVGALLDGGADARRRNRSGSTPLHLAVQNTGRGGSGSTAAKDEQRKIIALLLSHGAALTDVDGRGRSVPEASSSDWARLVLGEISSASPT